MDFLKNAASQLNQGNDNNGQQQQGQEQGQKSGGLMGKLNGALGGGAEGEAKGEYFPVKQRLSTCEENKRRGDEVGEVGGASVRR